MTEKDTLILYLHGNSFNRSQPHRVGLYKLLIKLGYYVLTIDYRGFGDSSPVKLSERTVVEDARAALSWISDKLGDKVKVRTSRTQSRIKGGCKKGVRDVYGALRTGFIVNNLQLVNNNSINY